MTLKSFFSALCLAAFAATASYGQLSDLFSDFEAFALSDQIAEGDPGSSDLDEAGWQVAGLNFLGDPDNVGDFVFFFGNFPAPSFSGNPGFTSVVADQGTGDQGLQHLHVFTATAEDVSQGGTTNFLDARVFQEQSVAAADLGNTVTLDFEFKRNFDNNVTDFGPTGNTNTFAFVRVLNALDETFATLGEDNFETTDGDLVEWADGQVTLLIDPSWEGQLLQFGFFSESQNGNGTGMVYDNVAFVADADVAGPLLGDVDLNGEVNFFDINPFIEILSAQGFQAEADIDGDGSVTFFDIQPFINILAGN